MKVWTALEPLLGRQSAPPPQQQQPALTWQMLG
jgi:hypothetical protein